MVILIMLSVSTAFVSNMIIFLMQLP